MKINRLLSNTLQALFFATMFCLLSNCKSKNKAEDSQDIVQQWTGKTIQFPSNSTCLMLGERFSCPLITAFKPYKILLYTDSTGCTSCKLRLDLWEDLMKEADTSVHGKIEFLFYFYPKNKNVLRDVMKRENFRQVVYANDDDALNQMNHFPKEMDYQCFLLDKDNKVITVGNPSVNTSVWELDKKIVNGQIKPDN